MAIYSYRTWETISLPPVTGDTFFCIYRRPTSYPGDDFNGRIYSGLVLDGYSIQNLNEILSQYVYTVDLDFDATDNVMSDDEQVYTFYIYYTQDDWVNWTRDIITIIYDWTYTNDNPSYKSTVPISVMDYRQYAVASMKSRDGEEEPVQVTLDGSTIDNFILDDVSTFTYIRNLSLLQLTDGFPHRLTINGVPYTIERTCYRYCLYYLNEYGGYDYMLFGGKEMQTDKINRLSYKRNYVANSVNFGKVDYLSRISETWELNTSWVTDTQAERLKHLFTSNKIWLQDLESGRIVPVNITNTSFEHKTYRNQGRRMYAYNISVSSSQEKYCI